MKTSLPQEIFAQTYSLEYLEESWRSEETCYHEKLPVKTGVKNLQEVEYQ